jgi:tetratricopeptide (TPR) repeat protein
MHHPESVHAVVLYLVQMLNYSTELSIKGSLNKAFEILRSAEEMVKNVKDSRMRTFIRAILANNLANFYYRRKKYNATARYAKEAFKMWKSLGTLDHSLYFMLKYGTAACLSGKYQESSDLFSTALLLLKEQSNLAGKGTKAPLTATFKLPLSFTMNQEEFVTSVNIIAEHNAAVSLCATRKYSQAMKICDTCLEGANEVFDVAHPWLKQILRTHEYASKQSQAPSLDSFKIKSDEIVHKEIQTMNRQVKEMLIQQQSQQQNQQQQAQSQQQSQGGDEVMSPSKRQQKLFSTFPFLKAETEEESTEEGSEQKKISAKPSSKSSPSKKVKESSPSAVSRKSSVATALSDARSRGMSGSPKKRNIKNTTRSLPPVAKLEHQRSDISLTSVESESEEPAAKTTSVNKNKQPTKPATPSNKEQSATENQSSAPAPVKTRPIRRYGNEDKKKRSEVKSVEKQEPKKSGNVSSKSKKTDKNASSKSTGSSKTKEDKKQVSDKPTVSEEKEEAAVNNLEQNKKSEKKTEEPKVEQQKIEEKKSDEPKNNAKSEPKVEQPKIEEKKSEESKKVEQPKIEEQAKIEEKPTGSDNLDEKERDKQPTEKIDTKQQQQSSDKKQSAEDIKPAKVVEENKATVTEPVVVQISAHELAVVKIQKQFRQHLAKKQLTEMLEISRRKNTKKAAKEKSLFADLIKEIDSELGL